MTYLSPQVEAVFGYAIEEIEGKWMEYLTDHPANAAGIEATERAIETGAPSPPYELQLRHADGGEVWVEIHEAPVVEGGEVVRMVGSMTDVTERKRVETELAAVEERLGQIVSHAPAVFYTARADGDLGATYVSPRLEDVFGWDPAENVADASFWRTRVHPDDLGRVREAVAGLGAGGQVANEYRFRHRDGTWRWVRDEVRLVQPNGLDSRELIGFMVDVTERKQLEEELRQSQKMEAVGRLAGGVAHDFNNLLTAITGYADLAWSQLPDGSPIRDDLDQVRQASERAGRLTRQLLAYSRRQVLQPKVLDLNATARDLERMLSRVIGEDVRLATRLEERLSPVLIDPGQLEQVILNLAVNARDAMPDGGTLTISTRSLHLERPLDRSSATVPAGRWVVLDVTDTGEGIPPDVHDRIFEPFFTTKPQGQGTGLGLATVYGIVKQSGGFVFFEPAPGRGTRFSILLPGVEGEPEARVSEVPAEPAPAAERILVIEDDAGVRRLVETTLTAAGYEVHAAASAEEALSLARSLGGIDVLVSDVILPDGRGPALEQKLRQILGDGFRTLYISGYAADQVDVEALRTTEFLGKPFTPSRLTATLRRILEPTKE
jgi:PAS domain S-box-containing protein